MGWRGAFRAIRAAAREAERDAKRRERAREQERAALAKAQELQYAAYVVSKYEQGIALATSLHRTSRKAIEWASLATASPPVEPHPMHTEEARAQQKLDDHRPSALEKLLHREEKVRAQLQAEMAAARDRDEARYKTDVEAYRASLQEYTEQRELAERILARNSEAMLEVVLAREPFADISEFGVPREFRIVGQGERMAADLLVSREDIIPKETPRLLSSGRLSIKQTPKSQHNCVYQDYVCSAVLRLATEILSLLPIEAVVVTALHNMLNPATGHLEEQPILSALIPRKTLAQLNLDAVDPSDAMRNFLHQIDFKQATGFRPVSRLDPEGAGKEGCGDDRSGKPA